MAAVNQPEINFTENIRRVRFLLGEIGPVLHQEEIHSGQWVASLRIDGWELMATVTGESRFLELAAEFRLDRGFADFLGSRLDDLQQVCYHFGCHHLVTVNPLIITLLIGNKLYFSGLQYYALKEAIADMVGAIGEIRRLLDPGIRPDGGEDDGHS